MAVVKGSTQEHLKVITYSPTMDLFKKVFWVVFIIVSVGIAYFVGGWHVTKRLIEIEDHRDALAIEVDEKSKLLQQVNQRVAVLEEGSKLDKQANDEVRASVKQFRDRIADLEKEVTFYKNIMAPAGKGSGLHIQKLELAELPNNAGYRYKVVLTQLEKNQNYVSGQAAISVIGQQNGQKTIYSLRELSKDQKDLGVKFRFRYFQNISGQLALPKGFKPEEVQVILQTTGKKPVRVENAFNWAIGESVNNVGQ